MLQTNQTLLGIIGGSVLLLIVGGATYYFEVNAKAPAAAPLTAETYQSSGMQALLTSTGLIKRLVTLQPVIQSEPNATQFATSDIGRVDITKSE